MAGTFTIQQIITFAQISQYLAGNDIASKTALRSGSINENLPGLLYMEGTLLQNMYTLNPGGSTIRKTAEYVLSLCGKYLSQAQTIVNNLAQSPPAITGPSNQTVNQNASATFTVSVVSSLPYTGQWYNSTGDPIIGQTSNSYVFLNAQPADSGKTFYFKATSSAGTTTSEIASLTVTSTIFAFTWYGDEDPNPMLATGVDTLTYQIQTVVVHNQPISIVVPQIATPNKFFVTKVVNTESEKTAYFNTQLNQGTIIPEDFNYKLPYTFGSDFRYATRQAVSWDYTQPLVLS